MIRRSKGKKDHDLKKKKTKWLITLTSLNRYDWIWTCVVHFMIIDVIIKLRHNFVFNIGEVES